METHPARHLVLHLLLLVATAGAAAVVGWQTGNATGRIAAVFVGFGSLVVALAWVQAVLRKNEEAERFEVEELKRKSPGAALFTAKDEVLRARAARLAYERWMVPAGTLVVGVGQGVAAWQSWRWLGRSATGGMPGFAVDRATLGMAFFGMLALVCFLVGRYAAGLARPEAHRWLRPSASQLSWAALLMAAAVGSGAVGWFGYPDLDRRLAQGLAVALGAGAAELGILLVLELYRPRRTAEPARMLYESRLLGLLSQPGGLVSTAAQALDYQFGFRVSETWFYRWLERALAWLVLWQGAVLWLASTVVIVDPHEQGLVERFGRRLADRGTLGPGLHLKWPWPVETVRVHGTREVRAFHVGFVADPKLERERTLLWTRPHYLEEFNLLVASREQAGEAAGGGDGAGEDGETSVPVNLLTASIPVQYHVTNVVQWEYGHAEPATMLERLATREVAHYLVSVDIEAIMSVDRLKAAAELREAIQARAAERGLGVEILFVGLQDIHPPVQVASAYEAVIGATQERETTILNARAYQAERVPLAEAEAARRVKEAEGLRRWQTAKASGAARMFADQRLAHAASPGVYERRAYLDAVVQGTGGARKYLMTATRLIPDYWVNLEDKLRPDLLDVSIPPARGEARKP